MSRAKLWTACALAAALTLPACSSSSSKEAGRVQVVAAFYPLQYVTQQVGGRAVDVASLTPSGVEPHDLELSSSQVRELADADLVVYLGHGFQPAVEDAIAGLPTDRKLDALAGIDLLAGAEEGEATDPHVWLDPSLLAQIGDQIATRLSNVAPNQSDLFDENARRLRHRLSRLDHQFARGLAHCRSRVIVTSHAAFAYMAARYHLKQEAISGIDPEAEPSPQRLAQVALFVEEHHITTIFFEELAPPDLAQTLARETGARTDVLTPLETPPQNGDYIDAMRSNLQRLRSALSCE